MAVQVKTAVLGATGYSGLELQRLLARHPHMKSPLLLSRGGRGGKSAEEIPFPDGNGHAASLPFSWSLIEEKKVELLFLATPHEVSRELVPEAIARGLRVIEVEKQDLTDLADIVEVGPFLHAFLILIVIPLTLAWLTQAWAARARSGRLVAAGASTLMVPLMVAVLAVVVASQIPKLDNNLTDVASVIPFYVAFLIIMAFAGTLLSRLFRLDVPASRAITFSGATRNSLVVLPLALALPAGYELAAAVVVTQTLVEIIGMVAYIRIIPRLLPNAVNR